jgi:hypothetical protein
MPRVGNVIWASSLAGAAILVLAVWAPAAMRSGAGRAACVPRGAHTLASDHAAQVFSWNRSVYACLGTTGAREKLGGADICNLPPGRVAPVKLAGPIVAYGLERCGVDTGSSTVVVRNLASAKPLADLPAGTLALGAESYVSVASLVLRRDGAAGWIATDSSLAGHRPTTYEVHRFTAGKSSLLDSGTAIGPDSLRLAGSRMTWRDGGRERSAGL